MPVPKIRTHLETVIEELDMKLKATVKMASDKEQRLDGLSRKLRV